MLRKRMGALVLVLLSGNSSACSCEEKSEGTHDSGTGVLDTSDVDTDIDSDSDTDTDTDADTDSDTNPVDPEIDWVEVPAGSFTFGSPIGTPCRGPGTEKEIPVTLTRGFLMSRYEITQRQWKALGFPLPHRAIDCDDCPITYINTPEAMAWCNALSAFEGLEECYDLSSCTGDIGGGCPDGDFYEMGCQFKQGVEPLELIDGLYVCADPVRLYESMYDCTGFRLPTGPEWEYTAKAGTTTNTYNGDITEDHDSTCADEPILNDIAWYCQNTGGADGSHADQIREIGLKQPNPWGLCDMLGNAREWVDYVTTGGGLDWAYGGTGEMLVDPVGPTEEDDARGDARGESFNSDPCVVRAAWQSGDPRVARGAAYGFRPVRTLPATAPDGGASDSGVK